MSRRTTNSFEAKLSILTIGTLFVVLLGLGHLAMSEFRSIIIRQKMETFDSVARSLAPYSRHLINDKDSHTGESVSSLVKNSKIELVYIVVADAEGHTLFAQSKNQAKVAYPEGLRWWLTARHILGYEAISPNRIHSVTVPVLLGQNTRGTFTAGFSLSELNKMINAVQAKILLGLTLGLIVGIILAVMMGRDMSQSLKRLIEGARAVSSGDFDVRVQPKTGDYIGQLSKEFNNMVDNLSINREQLIERANTDSLTGLYNHRYFQECLSVEMSRASRYNHSLSLLMIDIDFFKNLNDELGHPAGDAALVDVARIITESIRQSDVAIRYGGEEFAVILPETEEADALAIAERIRQSVEKHEFKFKDGATWSLTVSIGIAECPVRHSEQISLLLAADIALYQAKSEGRNRICTYNANKSSVTQDETENTYILFGANDMSTIEALAAAVDAKLKLPEGHSQTVAKLAAAAAQKLGMPEVSSRSIYLAALLRDIGQIIIPDSILSKAGELTAEEKVLIANHPTMGHSIVQKAPNLSALLPAILYHHERFDGTGYPLSTAGEDIQLSARILAVADAYQTMITARPYREEMTPEEAREELMNKSLSQFDPKIVQVFIDMLTSEKEDDRAA